MQKVQTKSKPGRKSKKKESAATSKSEDEIKRKAELEAKIRRRVALEEKAFRIVEQLLENPITEEFLITAAQSIDHNHYADVVEERAIIKQCGYPLCVKSLTNVPKQKYHISTKTNKVYDITERKNFCSAQCYKASKYFEKQLSATPVWLRDDEPPVTIQLLDIASNEGSLGEVVFISPRSELKEELDELKSLDARFVGKKAPLHEKVNTCSEGHDLDEKCQGRADEHRKEPTANSSGDFNKQHETAFAKGGCDENREDDMNSADLVTSDLPSNGLLLEDVAKDISKLCLERSLHNLEQLRETDSKEKQTASSSNSDQIQKGDSLARQLDDKQIGITPENNSNNCPPDLMAPLSIGIPSDQFQLGTADVTQPPAMGVQCHSQSGTAADTSVCISGDGRSGRITSAPDPEPRIFEDMALQKEKGNDLTSGWLLSTDSNPEEGLKGIQTVITASNAAAAKSRVTQELPKQREPNPDVHSTSEQEMPGSEEPAVGERGVKAKAVAQNAAIAKARVLSELLDKRDVLLRIQEVAHQQDKAVATPSSCRTSSRSLRLLQLIEDCTVDPDERQSGTDAKSSSEGQLAPDIKPKPADQFDPDTERNPTGKSSSPNRCAGKASSDGTRTTSTKRSARILANIQRASEQKKRLPNVTASKSPPGGQSGKGAAAGRSGKKEAKKPKASVLELIRRTLLDWKTTETARFLAGHSVSTADGPRYGQYAAYNRMFVGREYSALLGDETLDDEDDDDDDGPRGRLPDISQLRADEIYAARVMEFYGLTSRKKTGPRQTEGNTDQVADNDVILPMVDSHSQTAHRRKIVLDKLNKVFPDLLGPLKVSATQVSAELRTLVHTFNLTSTNIVLKPAEWTLIAYFLLHLLTLRCPDLDQAMQSEVATHYFKTMLLSVNITSSDVQSITDMMSSPP